MFCEAETGLVYLEFIELNSAEWFKDCLLNL